MIDTGTIKGRLGWCNRHRERAKRVSYPKSVGGPGGLAPLAGLEGSALHLSERAGARGGAPAIQPKTTVRDRIVGSSIGN